MTFVIDGNVRALSVPVVHRRPTHVGAAALLTFLHIAQRLSDLLLVV